MQQVKLNMHISEDLYKISIQMKFNIYTNGGREDGTNEPEALLAQKVQVFLPSFRQVWV